MRPRNKTYNYLCTKGQTENFITSEHVFAYKYLIRRS